MKFRTRLKALAGRALRYGGLLALIGLIALAAISPWRHPTLAYDGNRLYGQVASRYGAIDIFLVLGSMSRDKLPGFFEPLLKIEKSRTPRWNWRYQRSSLPVRNLELVFYTIPYWIPVSIIALPTSLIWWVWYRRRRRERIGHCHGCGYDLRGLPTPTTPTTPTCPHVPRVRAGPPCGRCPIECLSGADDVSRRAGADHSSAAPHLRGRGRSGARFGRCGPPAPGRVGRTGIVPVAEGRSLELVSLI